MPVIGAVSNLIIKPQSKNYEFLVENEYLSMRLASLCGIQTAENSLIDAKSDKAFAVKRFDRMKAEGKLKRIIQEDFCQALGIMPSNKYEKEGGPGFIQPINLLKKVCCTPAKNIKRFIDLFLFNLFIGDRDAHDKNFSLINGLKRESAPAYDLVCTSIYDTLSSKMAMSVNGIIMDEDVSITDCKQMIKEAQLSWVQFQKRLLNFVRLINEQLEHLRFTPNVNPSFMGKLLHTCTTTH